MGKKKDRNAPAAAASPSKTTRGFNPLIAGAIVIAVVGVGAFVLSDGTDEAATSSSASQAADADPRK